MAQLWSPAPASSRAARGGPVGLVHGAAETASRAQAAELGGLGEPAPDSSAIAQSAEINGLVQLLAGQSENGGDRSRLDLAALVQGVRRDGAQSVPHRAEMERRLGTPFAGVQAYLGEGARAACDQLDAEAFAVGNVIGFRSAQPDRETVAHELTHVLQQPRREPPSGKLRLGQPATGLERQADAVGQAVAAGAALDPAALGASSAAAGVVQCRRRARRKLPEDYKKLWEAHPHNYQDDEADNTDTPTLLEEQGWSPDRYGNTCAIRLSVMFNNLGGEYKLSRRKAAAAGIKPGRVPYSKKTGWFYILSAKEMWTYVSFWFGQPHDKHPARGYYKNSEAFEKAWSSEIQKAVTGKHGIVAFEKIFGYSGTGHVDVFNGEQLSDAPNWYPCKRLMLWHV